MKPKKRDFSAREITHVTRKRIVLSSNFLISLPPFGGQFHKILHRIWSKRRARVRSRTRETTTEKRHKVYGKHRRGRTRMIKRCVFLATENILYLRSTWTSMYRQRRVLNEEYRYIVTRYLVTRLFVHSVLLYRRNSFSQLLL